MLAKTVDTFLHRPLNLIGVRILQLTFGLTLMIRTVVELPYAGLFYGPNGASTGTMSRVVAFDLSWVDQFFFGTTSGWHAYLIPLFSLAGSFLLIFGKRVRLGVVIAILGYVLEGARATHHDGGDSLLFLTLIYMLLLSNPKNTWRKNSQKGDYFFHNVGVYAIYTQLSLMYITSGLVKLQGDLWLNGTAIFDILQIEYVGPSWQWMVDITSVPLVFTLLTYGTIAYQLGFVFTLGHRLHLFWVLLGISVHLGIALFMGFTLLSFSSILIGLILFTVRDNEWYSILKNLNTLKRVAAETLRPSLRDTYPNHTQLENIELD